MVSDPNQHHLIFATSYKNIKKKQSSKLAFPIFRCILNLNKINFKTWASNKYTGTVMVK